eukprot:scaffold33694_cov98-Cyclotella_meneghiniana.AAC.3
MLSPTTDGESVGVDPSLYSLGSAYESVGSSAVLRSTSAHPTPVRTNVSSSLGEREAGNLPSVAKKRVAIVDRSDSNNSWDDQYDDKARDDYSLVSGITASTTATVRGVRGVAQALSSGLFSSLETPKQDKGDEGGLSSLFQLKSAYKTPVASQPRPETPEALEETKLGQLKISTPVVDPKATRGIIAAEENDPSACRAWLYVKDEHTDLCMGTIGSKGLVCVSSSSECKFSKHKKVKTPLKDMTWYLLTKNEAVQISPSIPDEIASKSGLWAMYAKQMYNPPNWSSIFNHIRSNSAATSPSELITEAESNRLLQDGLVPKGVVPKTPKLIKGPLKEKADAPPEELAKSVKGGFKAAEASFADVYAEMTKLSSRVGIPSDPGASMGSCYGDIEATHLYASSIDASVTANRETLKAHHAALLKCEQNFTSYGLSIDQAVASSLAASKAAHEAQNIVHGFSSTGVINKVDTHGQSIDQLRKELASTKGEVSGLYDIIRDIISQIPALKQGPSASDSSVMASMRGEMDALRRQTQDELKVMKQAIDGQGPVSLGSWKFESAEDCAAQLSEWGVTTAIWEFIFDPFHLFGALLHRHRTHKAVGDQAVLSMKTNLTSSRLTAMASYTKFSLVVARPLVREQTPLSSLPCSPVLRHLSFSMERTASRGFLTTSRSIFVIYSPRLAPKPQLCFALPIRACFPFLDLLRDRASTAVMDFLKEMGELYRNLLAKACGMCTSYTREQKAEAWQQVLILVQVYCQEVSRVRAGARNLNNYADPMLANSLAMWASLSALRVHDSFQDNLYHEHPRIAPKLTSYILTTVLRKGELAPVEDKAQRAISEAQRAVSAATRAETQATSMRSDHDRFVSSFNQWKRSLKVDGAEDFPNKKKKFDRRKKNNTDDADDNAVEG